MSENRRLRGGGVDRSEFTNRCQRNATFVCSGHSFRAFHSQATSKSTTHLFLPELLTLEMLSN